MRLTTCLALPILLLLTIGCKGGGGLTVGRIDGPSSVDENSSAEFSVVAAADAPITYQWAVAPPSAGSFSDPTTHTTTFTAASVAEDTLIEIQVVVFCRVSDPVLKSRRIMIRDLPEGTPGGP